MTARALHPPAPKTPCLRGFPRFSLIVGYTAKEAAKGKFIILGAQFEGVSSGTIDVATITGVEGVAYDDAGAFKLTAPQIQIPNGIGYTTRYYLTDGWDNSKNDYAAGWCDGDGVIVTDTITPGVALWLKSVGADATANVAGAVSELSSVNVDCPANFALRANAFPIATTLNSASMSVSGIAGVAYDDAGAFKQTAPQVQIYNGVGYTTRYYLNDGWDNDKNDYAAGWCDGDGVIVKDTIPAAQGFWTKGVGSAFTLTFTK